MANQGWDVRVKGHSSVPNLGRFIVRYPFEQASQVAFNHLELCMHNRSHRQFIHHFETRRQLGLDRTIGNRSLPSHGLMSNPFNCRSATGMSRVGLVFAPPELLRWPACGADRGFDLRLPYDGRAGTLAH